MKPQAHGQPRGKPASRQHRQQPTRQTPSSSSSPAQPRHLPEPLLTFGPIGSPVYRRMEYLLQAIEAAVEGFDRRELSQAVKHLSESLTRHRDKTVRRDYLSDEIVQAAYCAHFLPWNVYRLLLSWRLSAPFSGSLAGKTIDDWGAGPLTGLLALWVAGALEASKDGGEKPVYRGIDKAGDMLLWGERLAGQLGIDELAGIETSAHALDFNEADDGDRDSRADLLLVVEAFNEWLPQRGRDTAGIAAFARTVRSAVKPGGELFVLEPASRVVSWGVMQLRESLRGIGASVLAPCTHAKACPLLDPRLKAWCHFRHPVAVHPAHEQLSRLGYMERSSLSYSFVHARLSGGTAPTADVPAKNPQSAARNLKPQLVARVFSDPIKVKSGHAVYACAPHGRIQIESPTPYWPRESGLEQGVMVEYKLRGTPQFDPRSRSKRIPLKVCRKVGG